MRPVANTAMIADFFLSLHLQMCYTNDRKQQDGNIADEVGRSGDVASSGIVTFTRKKWIPGLR